KPRSEAVRAYSNMSSGVRWAETTRTSWGMSSSLSTSTAWRIVSQSDALPMITPTAGRAASVMALAPPGGGTGSARLHRHVFGQYARSPAGRVAPFSFAHPMAQGAARRAAPSRAVCPLTGDGQLPLPEAGRPARCRGPGGAAGKGGVRAVQEVYDGHHVDQLAAWLDAQLKDQLCVVKLAR